jgi:hypothetical protein
MRAIPVAILAAAILASGTGRSQAADYCIKSVNAPISVTYVAKAFAVPPKGTCRTWSGFCVSGCSPDNSQTGSACTASNGSHVTFALTTMYLANNRQWDFVRLDLPSQSGKGNSNNLQEGVGQTISYDAKGGNCSQPVP